MPLVRTSGPCFQHGPLKSASGAGESHDEPRTEAPHRGHRALSVATEPEPEPGTDTQRLRPLAHVTTVERTPSAFRDQFKTRRGVPQPYVEGPPGWRSE